MPSTMGTQEVQKRGAPAHLRTRGSEPTEKNWDYYPPPRKWVFNASESDLSDGHLIFARDPVEFLAFLTFWAMSEIRMEGAGGGRHPPCIYLKGDQSPCILDPQMFWFCIAGLIRTGIPRCQLPTSHVVRAKPTGAHPPSL